MSSIKKYVLSFCLVLWLPLASTLHPFYVSICQIDHNPKTQSLEITLKLFTDDLERAMEQSGSEKLYLGTEREEDFAGDAIYGYINTKVKIKVNGQVKTYAWVGKEQEVDVTWCYLEIPSVASVEEVEVSNRLLLETFDQQTNLVHMSIAGQKKSLMLHRNQVKGTAVFKDL